MPVTERPDDFAARRARLRELSDAQLHERFWELVEGLVAPLVAEARAHTTPAIERSVLLRMGFTGAEAKALVDGLHARGLLGHGAGRLLVVHAERRGVAVREAGLALLAGDGWEEIAP
jgi:D-ornithine 4,5-aminomutase subunit alpha